MANPRFNGLMLCLLGVLTLLGNTLDVLPPAAFWVGLLMYPIGGYLVFVGSRGARDEAGARPSRSGGARPANRPGSAPAAPQVRRAAASPPARPQAPASPRATPVANELVLPADDDSEGMAVSTDVSFPVELQENARVADEIQKLHRLQREGVISAEELAIAKSKLLDGGA